MWWVLVGLAACDGGDKTPPPTGETGEPPVETTGAARVGHVGSISLWAYPPDAYYGLESTLGFAVFVEDDAGVDNLAECLVLGPPCLVEPGAPGREPGQVAVPASVETVDAGPRIRAGAAVLEKNPVDFGTMYLGQDFVFGPDARLAFDGDLHGYAEEDQFVFPDPLAGLSPDPGGAVALGPGDDLVLAWTPGTVGQVALRWQGADGVEVRPVEDDGSAVLTAVELGLEAPFDETWVTLARATHTVVDAGGNTVRVDATREQWYYLSYEDAVGWTDLDGSALLAEGCGAPDPLPDGRYTGTLADAAADLDLGYGNPLTGYQTAGRDRGFTVELRAGDAITVTFRQVALDAAVYVLGAECDPANALAAADAAFDGGAEVLGFTAPSDGRYTVVLDGFATDLGDRYGLELATTPAPP